MDINQLTHPIQVREPRPSPRTAPVPVSLPSLSAIIQNMSRTKQKPDNNRNHPYHHSSALSSASSSRRSSVSENTLDRGPNQFICSSEVSNHDYYYPSPASVSPMMSSYETLSSNNSANIQGEHKAQSSQKLETSPRPHCAHSTYNTPIFTTGGVSTNVAKKSESEFKQTNYEDLSLKEEDIQRLIDCASSNRNPIKGKRDVAMLYLLLDMKFACQKIADLKYRDVYGILSGTFQGIYRFSSFDDETPAKALKCQTKTAESIRAWVLEVHNSFGWNYKAEAPLFVPLALYGENRIPRRIALKRDAISKVFSSIKLNSGVQMSKEMVNRTTFSGILDDVFASI